MRKLLATAGALLALSATPSLAGVYGDELTKCLVTSASDNDKLVFVKFIFSAIAEHPAVKPMANITDATDAALDKDTADLYGRLMYSDCRQQMINAMKYEDVTATMSAFTALGQVAMRSLMADPAVRARFTKMGGDGDKAKMLELYKEAGIPAPAGLSPNTGAAPH